MEDKEIAQLKARVAELERIVRIGAIQATGDAVDEWFKIAQDGNSTPVNIERAGKDAAREKLATKNREAHQLEAAGIHMRE